MPATIRPDYPLRNVELAELYLNDLSSKTVSYAKRAETLKLLYNLAKDGDRALPQVVNFVCYEVLEARSEEARTDAFCTAKTLLTKIEE